MVNVHSGVRDELYKVASVNMCPNTTGQVPHATPQNLLHLGPYCIWLVSGRVCTLHTALETWTVNIMQRCLLGAGVDVADGERAAAGR